MNDEDQPAPKPQPGSPPPRPPRNPNVATGFGDDNGPNPKSQKKTWRINMPPKPTAAPTVKLPTLPPDVRVPADDGPAAWKHYVYAAVMSFFIPFLAMLLQTGWTLWAHPYRLYQASLHDVDLSSPIFWLGNASLGLLIFLILCLVIKSPLRCWIVMVTFLVGLTCLLMLGNSAVYK